MHTCLGPTVSLLAAVAVRKSAAKSRPQRHAAVQCGTCLVCMCLPPDCCIGMRSSSRMCSHPPSSATYTARCRRRHLLCRPAAARPAGRPGSGRGAAAAAARAAGPGLPAVRGGGRTTPGGWHACVRMQLPWIAGDRAAVVGCPASIRLYTPLNHICRHTLNRLPATQPSPLPHLLPAQAGTAAPGWSCASSLITATPHTPGRRGSTVCLVPACSCRRQQLRMWPEAVSGCTWRQNLAL